MISHTDGTQSDAPRRTIVVSDDATFFETSTGSIGGVQSTDSPTAAPAIYDDVYYEMAVYVDDIQDSMEDLRKLIRAIELIEHHHERGRREYYQKRFYKSLLGTFLPYVFSRRLMVSRSGFKGLKGVKYRS